MAYWKVGDFIFDRPLFSGTGKETIVIWKGKIKYQGRKVGLIDNHPMTFKCILLGVGSKLQAYHNDDFHAFTDAFALVEKLLVQEVDSALFLK